jgi:hypothetical protein
MIGPSEYDGLADIRERVVPVESTSVKGGADSPAFAAAAEAMASMSTPGDRIAWGTPSAIAAALGSAAAARPAHGTSSWERVR